MTTRSHGLLATLAGFLTLPWTAAADGEGGRCIPPETPGTGVLTTVIDGKAVDFPLKHTSVHADVSGPVARVRVTQTFQNPYEETIEAAYVFPLPHEAAVSDFEMRIGERIIAGLIERREEARRIYENARNAGHVAALLEQERPNIFTQSVANILPGNEIDVTLTYVETLDYEAGTWELVFPTVVGPRFNPPASGGGGDLVPAGGVTPGILPYGGSSVPDADRINPPFLPPGVRSGHDLDITVDWDAGIPIESIDSPTHRIDGKRQGDTRRVVTLHPLDTLPNKDFVLRCRAAGRGPDTGVLARHDGESGYVSVLLHPKLDLQARDITPKEMVFVLDCSGSMSGEPMAAAKALVRHALTNVNPQDTFQIIRFSSNASGLAPAPIPATPDHVKRGLDYLEQLRGSGGTMMIEGIKASLGFPEDPERMRIVMFLTDGYIGNDDEILAAVRDRIGRSRLFAFGVGSSVNRSLLDGLALEGRGEVQYFLPGSSVREEVSKFYDRFRNPYLTDLELVWNGVEIEDVYPARVPDLFGGKPLVVHGRFAQGGRGTLEVRGRIAGKPWSQRVALDLPRSESGNPAVATLWARARIGDLERTNRGGTNQAAIDEITELALHHRLVTRYTSFVAVEEELVVSDGKPTRVRVPVQMPEGVSWEGVFGRPEETLMAQGRGGLARKSMLGASPPASIPVGKGEALEALGYLESRELVESEIRVDDVSAAGPGKDEDAARQRAAGGLVLRLATDRERIRAGESVTLTITLENKGSAPVAIPETLELGGGFVRLRVIDRFWNETRLGVGAGPPVFRPQPMRELAAGATRTVTIRLTPAEAAFLATPGTYHLILDGAPLRASGDSDRITIRIG